MSPKYYEVACRLKTGIKRIRIISNNENFNERRIKRELFGKGKEEQYEIISSKILVDKLGI